MATSTDRGERYTEGEAAEPEACMSLVDFMTDLPIRSLLLRVSCNYTLFLTLYAAHWQQKHHPIQTITLPLKWSTLELAMTAVS